MSALSQLLPVPVLNQRLTTWKALKKNIQDWSVREKDEDRVLYWCRDNQCQWGLRGNHMEESDIQVTVLESKHTCIAPLVSRLVASNQKHDGEFTSWTLQQIQKSQINARIHQVERSSISEGRVTAGQRQLALQHCVNLLVLVIYIRILDFHVNMHWLVSYISSELLNSIFQMIYL